mmetsp:Transcript_20108/g.43300  ORF Transcript_20108/g.43300 Transcript_20108/m.43300 type:complete len:300 (-) Transcript_20108:52-951(-)
MSLDNNFRIWRCFVRVIDASKMLQLSGGDIGVLSLGVALLQFFNWNVQKDFIEWQALLFVPLPHSVAIGLVGGNESHQRNDTGIGKQRCKFSRSTNRFRSIRFGETQVAIDSGTQVVSVQSINMLSIVFDKLIFQGSGDRCLSRSTAARHPQRGTFLAKRSEPILCGQMTRFLTFASFCLGALNNVRRRIGQRFLTKFSNELVRVLQIRAVAFRFGRVAGDHSGRVGCVVDVGVGLKVGVGLRDRLRIAVVFIVVVADQGLLLLRMLLFQSILASRSAQNINDGKQDTKSDAQRHAFMD